MVTYRFDPYGPQRGSYWTKVVAGSATISVPADTTGSSASATLAHNILLNSTAFIIDQFLLTSTDGTARTLTFNTWGGSAYDALPFVLTVPASATGGTPYPLGIHYEQPSGFAFTTSNAALLGWIMWRPVGSM